jgi:hypothetical protein
MRALYEFGVALALALVACGGSGSSGGGGHGGTANGGAGGAGTGAHHAGGHGAHNQTGGASSNGGGSANGGAGGGTMSSASSGVGGCDMVGFCADQNGMTGCAHCALDDQSTPPGPCASLIDACVMDTTSPCAQYAICCMGQFPCAAHCDSDVPGGKQAFAPTKSCVCSNCQTSCSQDCN